MTSDTLRPMQTRLNLRYTGPAVDSGSMDVYDASANMIAFTEFLIAASKAAFGDQIKTEAKVTGFGHGSFITNFVIDLMGPAATIFTSFTPEHLTEVIKDAWALWKHLRGQPPQKIEHNQNQTVDVTNNNGQVTVVNIGALNLVFDEKATEAAGRFVRTALSQDGMDSVKIGIGDQPIAEANQAESEFFVPVLPSEDVTDTTFKMVVTIEAPVFKDGNKWRFNDGQTSFFADIRDQEFLQRVDNGEPFSKGDLLTVEIQLTQERAGMKLVTERSVIKVHDHRRGPQQDSLLGSAGIR